MESLGAVQLFIAIMVGLVTLSTLFIRLSIANMKGALLAEIDKKLSAYVSKEIDEVRMGEMRRRIESLEEQVFGRRF